MSTAIKCQVFDRWVPNVHAGDLVTIEVAQTLSDAGGNVLLAIEPAPTVKLKVEGPQLQLDPSEIAGVYPAPNSEDSPAEYLPHVALTRRTLPWERRGPSADPNTPWMAVLLVDTSEGCEVEATTVQAVEQRDPKTFALLVKKFEDGGLGLTPQTALKVVYVPDNLLPEIMPTRDELELLCHGKRSIVEGTERDAAIVIGNRLPDASGDQPKVHTALLVSLERRDDLYDRFVIPPPPKPHQAIAVEPGPATPTSQPQIVAPLGPGVFQHKTALIVLHSWSFTPSTGADFEQVMKLIRWSPNGGVLRFGNLPKHVHDSKAAELSGGFQGVLDEDGYLRDPLPHDQAEAAVYRGPLRPFPTAGRGSGFAIRSAPDEFADAPAGTPLDYSYATAFELGRLLALADSGILEDLRNFHGVPDRLPDRVAVDKVPAILRRPDWTVDPAWFEKPWGETNTLIRNVLPQNGDFTGIAAQVTQWSASVTQDLSAIPPAVAGPVTPVDLTSATGGVLTKQFPDVVNAAKS